MTDQRFECCGRPMNPMRAGTGTPPRASDELWCDTCGTTLRYASLKKDPASSPFVYPPAPPTRPIERYVRAQSGIIGWAEGAFLKPVLLGVIEIGLQYDKGAKPSAYRSKLAELGEVAARVRGSGALDEDAADAITEDLDARIVGLWGDRPRFIEVWRGFGDDATPLTQVYAPYGWPRDR